jgi:hypothetical protein
MCGAGYLVSCMRQNTKNHQPLGKDDKNLTELHTKAGYTSERYCTRLGTFWGRQHIPFFLQSLPTHLF